MLFSMNYFAEKLFYFIYQSNSGMYGVIDVLEKNSTSSILGNGNTQFAQEILIDNSRIILLATRYISEESMESGASFEPFEKAIRKNAAAELEQAILNAKIDEIESMYVYNYEKSRYEYPNSPIDQSLILSNFSSEDQIAADNNSNTGRGITIRNGQEYYKGFPLSYVPIDETTIIAAHEDELQRTIISEKASFENSYKELKNHLSSLKNYSYFIENKETGLIYTNIDVSNIANATKNMTEYSVSLIDGSLKVSSDIADMVGSGDNNLQDLDYYYGEGGYVNGSSENLFNAVFPSSFDTNKYNIYIHVNTSASTLLPGDEYNTFYNTFEEISSTLRNDLLFLVLSTFLWIGSIVFLTINAGVIKEDGTIKMAPIDAVPNSIHLFFSLLIFAILALYIPFGFYVEYLDENSNANGVLDFTTMRLLTSVSSFIANVFFVEWIMSVSRHMKTSTFFKNTIINRLFIENVKRIEKWSRASKVGDSYFNFKLRVVLPAFVSIATLIPVSIFTAFLYYWEEYIVAVPLTIAIVFYIVMFLRYIVNLATGLENISNALSSAEKGEFDFKVDTESSPKVIKILGEMTNNLTEGMKVAVDETVKGERMKAELITNVSHDLKTPLTSIITYTGLLKQCNIEDESAREYIDVLEEKSNRLKKLIEDLVETSKANSGNMKLELMELNVSELVEQIYGEYEDILKEVNLDLRYDVPDEPILIVADGEKTYRVIENLFSNVKKYAMPGTRVFLNVSKEQNFAAISMKNVSKDEMHFDTEMLAERFVRGDSARSTEGSGLGLSIAKSITELEGGKFEVSVDGDLFCVTIKLPLKH